MFLLFVLLGCVYDNSVLDLEKNKDREGKGSARTAGATNNKGRSINVG